MSTAQATELAVIGAGAWGTMLAVILAQNNHRVKLWTRRPELANTINQARENSDYLPGLCLPNNLTACSNLDETTHHAEAVIIAVPSYGLRTILEKLPQQSFVISASKGFEITSFKRFTEVMAEYQPAATLAAISGPNIAREIAAGKPAAATLASEDFRFAVRAQNWFNQASFRVYSSPDLIGVETAGALKNVIALAAGMSDGLDLGENAKAGIITRGLAELVRLGEYLGGDRQSFYGLAGLGDTMTTCSSRHSRNRSAGQLLAKGQTLDDLREAGLNAEGIPTVKAVHMYAKQNNLDLPISREVYNVIYEGKSPYQALSDLMERNSKPEWDVIIT